jgi:hypothetical protein
MIRAKRLVVSAWLYVPVLGFVRPEKPEENQALPTIVLNSFTDEPGSVQYQRKFLWGAKDITCFVAGISSLTFQPYCCTE